MSTKGKRPAKAAAKPTSKATAKAAAPDRFGLSAEELEGLADALDISLEELEEMVAGKRAPPPELAAKLKKALQPGSESGGLDDHWDEADGGADEVDSD